MAEKKEEEKIVKVYGKFFTVVGKHVADANQIGLSQGGNVEEKISDLLNQIAVLRQQVEDLIAGGGVTPPTIITDALILSDGSYLKLKDGSYLKLKI